MPPSGSWFYHGRGGHPRRWLLQAYRDQQYERSIELYEALVAAGLEEQRESAQIYYNRGARTLEIINWAKPS